MNKISFLVLGTAFAFILGGFIIQPGLAQNREAAEPDLPESIEGLVAKGAQIRYLGNAHGLDGWIMVFKGQEQYFYATPDGQAFISGLLFSGDGTPLTVRQVQELRESGRAGLLDNIISRRPDPNVGRALNENRENMDKLAENPAQKLYEDVQDGNWVSFGGSAQTGAPVIYAFIDPTCPHCHDFIQELKPGYLDTDRLELRVLPVSRFTDQKEILQKAAFMLASPEPEKDFYAHMAGQDTALPVDGEFNTQAVQQNMAIAQKWGLDAIPFVVYRAKSGEIKIIRGKARDPEEIYRDLKLAV